MLRGQPGQLLRTPALVLTGGRHRPATDATRGGAHFRMHRDGHVAPFRSGSALCPGRWSRRQVCEVPGSSVGRAPAECRAASVSVWVPFSAQSRGTGPCRGPRGGRGRPRPRGVRARSPCGPRTPPRTAACPRRRGRSRCPGRRRRAGGGRRCRRPRGPTPRTGASCLRDRPPPGRRRRAGGGGRAPCPRSSRRRPGGATASWHVSGSCRSRLGSARRILPVSRRWPRHLAALPYRANTNGYELRSGALRCTASDAASRAKTRRTDPSAENGPSGAPGAPGRGGGAPGRRGSPSRAGGPPCRRPARPSGW